MLLVSNKVMTPEPVWKHPLAILFHYMLQSICYYKRYMGRDKSREYQAVNFYGGMLGIIGLTQPVLKGAVNVASAFGLAIYVALCILAVVHDPLLRMQYRQSRAQRNDKI